MDESLKVTNIKIEPTESMLSNRVKIPTNMQSSLVKQEMDYLVQSEIYIKTEAQDESEFPVIAGTSQGTGLSDDINLKIYEPIVKIECVNEIIQDPLSVNRKIKGEEHFLTDLKGEPKIKTEQRKVEKNEHLLETAKVNLCGSGSNYDQEKLLARNGSDCKDKKYVCDECNKTFRLKCFLDRHSYIHTGIKPYTCDVCGKSFNVKSNLDKHMLIHNGEKPHICDVCKKVFRHKSHLNDHKLFHSGVKPFSCDVCAKSFTHKHHLVIHNRIHTGEKPYFCDVCHKAFAHTSHLTEHRRTHTGEKPFACDICTKSFVVKSNLNKHKKIHKN